MHDYASSIFHALGRIVLILLLPALAIAGYLFHISGEVALFFFFLLLALILSVCLSSLYVAYSKEIVGLLKPYSWGFDRAKEPIAFWVMVILWVAFTLWVLVFMAGLTLMEMSKV